MIQKYYSLIIHFLLALNMSGGNDTLNKEELNPLFRPRFKARSVDSTRDLHLPRLQDRRAKYKYVLIGDSMFERYLTTGSGKLDPGVRHRDEHDNPNEPNVDLWKKYHNMKAINLGVGGDGISEIQHRLFSMRSIMSWPEKPNKIVVWVGTNDVTRYDEDVVFDGLVHLVESIRDCYVKTSKFTPEIGIVSILPRFVRSDKISVSDLNRSIQRLNYKLAKYAQTQDHCDFLDVYFDFYDHNKILSEYFDDHIHMNNRGYRVFDKKFHDFLTSEKVEEKTTNKSGTSASDGPTGERYIPGLNYTTDKKQKKRRRRKHDDTTDSVNQEPVHESEQEDEYHAKFDEETEAEYSPGDYDDVGDDVKDVENAEDVENVEEEVVEEEDDGWNTVDKPTKQYTKRTIKELQDMNSLLESSSV